MWTRRQQNEIKIKTHNSNNLIKQQNKLICKLEHKTN